MRLRWITRLAVAPLLVAAHCGPLRAADGAGPFTAAEAAKGRAVFDQHCAMCHGARLQGRSGPSLTGRRFAKAWAGRPVRELADFQHGAMPIGDAGLLGHSDYAAVTAYLLSRNGLRPGPRPIEDNLDTALRLR